MKIGKTTTVTSAICGSDDETIIVRGADLCRELIGKLSFTDYFWLLVTGERPSPMASRVLDATLVAIAEHGLVPSVQASRMTLAAAPDAVQGAVAAGILGCGSVILGSSETAGRLFLRVDARSREKSLALEDAAADVVREMRSMKQAIPGYGHPLHKARDPRVARLFAVAAEAGTPGRFIAIAEAVEKVLPGMTGRDLRLNVSAAIPAVMLDVGFPAEALKGVPILARTAGLIGHLTEELTAPIGFALSYQASREQRYTGALPPGVTLKTPHAE
ncbi:MAG: citryl-CoA lyase [Aquincola sp.]|nr:citryl-CoA lyase [Aquincola sp.]